MSKLIIRAILLIVLPVTGYFLMSCDAGTASGDTGTQFQIILVGQGSFCDEFFDDKHDMTLTVTVDKVIDTNTGQTELHDTDIMTVDNTFDGKLFDLNIPETGGFAINVQLNSTDCMECCSVECSFPPEGRPLLRDLQTFAGDPGGIIIFELDIIACNCC
jgi:hypothetical protein